MDGNRAPELLPRARRAGLRSRFPVRQIATALVRFVRTAVRPLRGLPTWIELPATITLGIGLVANASIPADAGLDTLIYGWVRGNRLLTMAVAFGVLFLVAGVRQTLAMDGNREPRLAFTRIIAGNTYGPIIRREEVHDASTGQHVQSREVALGNPFGIEAVVVNLPSRFQHEATVLRAVVSVAFYEGPSAAPAWSASDGYWADNDAPTAHDRGIGSDIFRTRDLHPNGQEHRISIAMKFPGESVLRPWNLAAMRNATIVPAALPAGTYRVQFSITGAGLPEPFVREFWLVNPDGTGDPSVHQRMPDGVGSEPRA